MDGLYSHCKKHQAQALYCISAAEDHWAKHYFLYRLVSPTKQNHFQDLVIVWQKQ